MKTTTNKIIYLDNAATTPLLPEVRTKIVDYLSDYGNPSSLYQIGVNNKEAIRYAKYQMADLLSCSPDEIIITSGASESNSTALISGFLKNMEYGSHVITSKIEHHSILAACKHLEKYYGAEITYLDVDEAGLVDVENIVSAMKGNTSIVSIMSANNEIGTINNIRKIAEAVKFNDKGVLLHVDATQSFGK